MLTQDWMMRQIETMTLAIAKLIFQKDTAEYRSESLHSDVRAEELLTDADRLYISLNALLHEGRVSEGEDLLFEALEQGGPELLEVAIDFYYRANLLSDQALTAGNFSRGEIEEGLRDVMEEFEIILP